MLRSERSPWLFGFVLLSLCLHGIFAWLAPKNWFGRLAGKPVHEITVLLEPAAKPKPKPVIVAKPKPKPKPKLVAQAKPKPKVLPVKPKLGVKLVQKPRLVPMTIKKVAMAQPAPKPRAPRVVTAPVRPAPVTPVPKPVVPVVAVPKTALVPVAEPTPDAVPTPTRAMMPAPRLVARREPRAVVVRAAPAGGTTTAAPSAKPGGRSTSLQTDTPVPVSMFTMGGGSGSEIAVRAVPKLGGARTASSLLNPLAALAAPSSPDPSPSPNAVVSPVRGVAVPSLGKLAGRTGAGKAVGGGIGSKSGVGVNSGGTRVGVGSGGNGKTGLARGDGNQPGLSGLGSGLGKGFGLGDGAGDGKGLAGKGNGLGRGLGDGIGVRRGAGRLASTNDGRGGFGGLAGLLRGGAAGSGGGGTGGLGTVKQVPFSLKGDIYFLEPGTRQLPADFSRLKSVGAIYATELNVPTRSFTEGFPGVTNRFEWFAINYNGVFNVVQPGTYNFKITSDDGSKLIVDGRMVIDNDGQHSTAMKSGTIVLSKGKHTINVQYFQGPAAQIALVLDVSLEK